MKFFYCLALIVLLIQTPTFASPPGSGNRGVFLDAPFMRDSNVEGESRTKNKRHTQIAPSSQQIETTQAKPMPIENEPFTPEQLALAAIGMGR